MITAPEALSLPTAQLSEEEKKAADALEAAIEKHVRFAMERRGCDFSTTLTNRNVIAEVHQRLIQAKWKPQWEAMAVPSPVQGGGIRHTGWTVHLVPTDEAYREAAARQEGEG